jgi:pimeloyl-ACP methyl ester carboxylesterase
MSEFFLPDGRPEKPKAYMDFRRCFYQAVSPEGFEHFEIPYEGVHLPAMRLKAAREKGVILLHGGYDSFMEEFYLQVKETVEKGYSFVVFEGPGQGRTLQDGLKMTPDWEKPVSAVLDFLDLRAVTLVGISLGGYLALRAAAFEPRIQRVVAYDVVYDAFTCFTEHMPEPFRSRFREMVKTGQREEINRIAETLRVKDDLLDWAFTHGMYITGTEDPFAYFKGWAAFSTEEFSPLVGQDVLLLAGENDHLIPLDMYYKQKEALVNARSVRGRIFTAEEGADQHCQVGNVELAWNEILHWLNGLHA